MGHTPYANKVLMIILLVEGSSVSHRRFHALFIYTTNIDISSVLGTSRIRDTKSPFSRKVPVIILLKVFHLDRVNAGNANLVIR